MLPDLCCEDVAMKTCTNPHHQNADPTHYARGLCQACWKRLRDRGTLEPARPTKTCSVCPDPHVARGFCRKHWRSWKLYGDPLAVKEYGRERCSIPGCEDPHRCRGLCSKHWAQGYRMRRSSRLSDVRNRLPIHPLLPHLEDCVDRYGDRRSVEERLGLSRGHLDHLLDRNKTVDLDTADQICIQLGLPFDALFNQEVA